MPLSRFVSAFVLVCALLAPAGAGAQMHRIVLKGSQAEETNSASTSASREARAGSHMYTAVRYPNEATGTDRCMIWHAALPEVYQAGQHFDIVYRLQQTGTSTTFFRMRTDLRCIGPGEDYHNITSFNSGVVADFSPSGSADTRQTFSLRQNTAVSETNCDPLDEILVRICRIGNDTDNSGTIYLFSAELQYPCGDGPVCSDSN